MRTPMKALRRALPAALLLVALTAGAARAQQAAAMAGGSMPDSYRELQLRMLETERQMILHMIDSMPALYFREKATPAQRDFGQQLYHAASAVPFILGRFAGAPRPTFADSAASFGKDGLRTYVNAAYDYGTNVLRTQTAADREQAVPFFNQQIPKWQIWDELHQHTMWTLGQVVANFRNHGMAPPAFMFF